MILLRAANRAMIEMQHARDYDSALKKSRKSYQHLREMQECCRRSELFEIHEVPI